MTVGLLLTAFGLGLRHGIDWDHIAAIADLSSTAESRRRGFMLSFLYAVGHGAVVIALGLLAILFGAALPEGVDLWMGRIVGLTLVALGAWVLIELMRKGRDFRLRSRWILVLGGTFAGLRRVREATARRRLSIEHDHEHPHVLPEHDDRQAHDHDHPAAESHLDVAADGGDPDSDSDSAPARTAAGADVVGEPEVIDLREAATTDADAVEDAAATADVGAVVDDRAAVGGGRGFGWSRSGRSGRGSGDHSHTPGHSHTVTQSHSHRHRHETVLADSAAGTGNGTAAGIGLLHGIGFESPTQIAVFVASTSVVGAWAGVGLLVAWVAGLIVANSLLAVLAAYGLLGAERNFTIYAVVAVVVGVASLVMGLFLLFGLDVLPAVV